MRSNLENGIPDKKMRLFMDHAQRTVEVSKLVNQVSIVSFPLLDDFSCRSYPHLQFRGPSHRLSFSTPHLLQVLLPGRPSRRSGGRSALRLRLCFPSSRSFRLFHSRSFRFCSSLCFRFRLHSRLRLCVRSRSASFFRSHPRFAAPRGSTALRGLAFLPPRRVASAFPRSLPRKETPHRRFPPRRVAPHPRGTRHPRGNRDTAHGLAILAVICVQCRQCGQHRQRQGNGPRSPRFWTGGHQ